LIKKILENKISLDHKIETLICCFLDCLAGIGSYNPNEVLDKLEKYINELIHKKQESKKQTPTVKKLSKGHTKHSNSR